MRRRSAITGDGRQVDEDGVPAADAEQTVLRARSTKSAASEGSRATASVPESILENRVCVRSARAGMHRWPLEVAEWTPPR